MTEQILHKFLCAKVFECSFFHSTDGASGRHNIFLIYSPLIIIHWCRGLGLLDRFVA
jgi:hypothetical protein